MLRYGTYIFGGDYSLYVVIDDGQFLVLEQVLELTDIVVVSNLHIVVVSNLHIVSDL